MREIGAVWDVHGLCVHVGVDYGHATIRTGLGGVTLDAAQREALAQLWVRASHEADADYAALNALDAVPEAVP